MHTPSDVIAIPGQARRIGFCADVHADLNSVLAMREARPDIDHWFCAGDVADCYKALHYNQPALRAMHRFRIPSVMGNHDYHVRERDIRKLGEEARPYLSTMPLCLHLRFAGLRIHVYHATPTSREHFLYGRDGEAAFRKHFGDIGADLFVLDHTHVPSDVRFGGKRFINPGALGAEDVLSSFCLLHQHGEAEIVHLKDT